MRKVTVGEVIATVDSMKPNSFEEEQKKKWIEQVEITILEELVKACERKEESGEADYTDNETVLVIPVPYDDVYRYYVEAQIDYGNGEIDKYNNSMGMFNQAYETMSGWYIRNHMPLQKGKFNFGRIGR